MVKVADLPSFDMAESLKTEEDIVMYLNIVLEENDPAELAHALGVIAKARGMTQIAKEAGIGREALYKALRQDSAPRFDTINRVGQHNRDDEQQAQQQEQLRLRR